MKIYFEKNIECATICNFHKEGNLQMYVGSYLCTSCRFFKYRNLDENYVDCNSPKIKLDLLEKYL